ncbi:MAG: endonuclease III domain-containing protein [Candidatus Limnocylindrus sp.]
MPRGSTDPARAWAVGLEWRRTGLAADVLAGLAALYGHPAWKPRLDPISELVTTILSQNTSDTNAERAFAALRTRYPSWEKVERAPVRSLAATIRSGGLAAQKAPRIKAALRATRLQSGNYDLKFLATMEPLAARAWLTAIPGIGPKTASIVMLFCFGVPLMPVDTHVERVSKRIGLLPPNASLAFAHDAWLHLVPPEAMYEAHVALIRHGRGHCDALRPTCATCPVRQRCRFVNRRAP